MVGRFIWTGSVPFPASSLAETLEWWLCLGCGSGFPWAGTVTPKQWSWGGSGGGGRMDFGTGGPPHRGSAAAILWLSSVRLPPCAQARPWRREIPASIRCDAPERRRRTRGLSPLGWPCGGRGPLRPHFSAFPNCGRWEGARRAGESVRLRSSRGGSGRCGCCVLGPGKDRVESRVLILSARDLA